MPDLPEIKAKVTVEYDGSGLEEARKDLASLGDLAGPVGEGTGSVGEALAGMNDQFAESARSAGVLATSVGALETPLSRGATSISQWSDALGESQGIIESTGTSIQEQLSAPLEDMSQQMIDAAPPMLALSEHAQSVATQISEVGDSFAQLQEPLAQSVPLLPQYAESLHAVGEGTNYAAENMSVFQDALQNPYPFSMIQSHLDETGQSWSDFTSSIGDNNTQMLHDMATTSDVTHEVLGGMTSDFQGATKASEEFGNVTDAAMGGMGPEWLASLTGLPMDEAFANISKVNEAVAATGEVAGESAGLFEGLGSLFSGGWMMGLNNLMMPMFALQMGSMVVGQLATGIYNAAAIAEGPAAHSFGSFTGVIDALGQSAQRSFQQFSESFGQGVLPSLNAMNYQSQQGGGFWGDVGRITGGGLGMLLSGGEVIYGAILNSIGLGPAGGLNIAQTGMEGFRNYWAQFTGQPQPYQGPGPETQLEIYRSQQLGGQMIQDAGNAQKQAATVLAESASPTNLAANNFLTASQQYAQQMQQSYDISHPISRAELQAQAMYDNYVAQTAGGALPYTPGSWTQTVSQGGFDWSGVGNFFGGIGQGLSSLFAPGGLLNPGDSGAGRVGLGVSPGMGIGDQIAQQISGIQLPHIDLSNITAGLSGAFSGMSLPHIDLGGILSGLSGAFSGMSLPHIDLGGIMSGLQGAFSGLSLPHIDLGGIMSGLQGAFSGLSLPSINLSGIMSGLQGAFSGLSLPHIDLGGIMSSLQGAFAGIQLPSMPDIGGMLSGAMDGMFSGLQLPKIPDIGGMLSGAMGGIFNGIQIPKLPDIAGMINSALSGIFAGISMPSIPLFASGVENYTGLAIVGEAGPELVSLNGGSVYPLTGGAPNSSISLPWMTGGGGNSTQSISINIDGRALAVAMAPYIVSDLRLVLGAR